MKLLEYLSHLFARVIREGHEAMTKETLEIYNVSEHITGIQGSLIVRYG